MTSLTRRDLVRTSVAAGAAVATATGLSAASAAVVEGGDKHRIVGIACSPRPGKTTAASLKICLEAARQVDETIETELIELAGLRIHGNLAAGIPLEAGERDDFPTLVPKLADPAVRGIIIGTPVYFGNMSSLCKAFLDRCIAFYSNGMTLSNKVAGVLAVGGTRNGGQEVTVRSVQASLFCQEMIIVGNGRPASRFGATLWSGAEGGVTNDEFGVNTAKNLGRRVAEVVLHMK